MRINKFLLLLALFVGVFSLTAHALAAECSESTVCGQSCTYGGETYDTVSIGTQCWFKQNLNIGTAIGRTELPDDVAPNPDSPSSVSKWCYDDTSSYCDSEGGLYTWLEANALPQSCRYNVCSLPKSSRGICPSGWHVPSDEDFSILETSLTAPAQTCDPLRLSWDCVDAGLKLILGGTSGFDAISAGYHETNGELSLYSKREPSIHFWSSSPCLGDTCRNYGHAYLRSLIGGSGDAPIRRNIGTIDTGISIRCIANTDTDGDGVWDNEDLCQNTTPDTWTQSIGSNRWQVMSQPSYGWYQNKVLGKKKATLIYGHDMGYTYGCSGRQILDILSSAGTKGLSSQYKSGISTETLDIFHLGYGS